MKKLWTTLAMILALTMLAACAHAADIVCVQPNALGSEYEYSIMRATLDNGQDIYYLSMENEPMHRMEDVNFDGHEDFVPTTIMGASNFFSVFYLYNPQIAQYEPVYTGDQGFCNYTLVPEKGYVVSWINDGYLYRDIKIYQWQNGALALLRRGTINGLRSVEYEHSAMVERWDFSQYEMIIHDYTIGEQGGQLIYQETYPENDPQSEAHVTLFEAKLWEGL